jgi:beta-lactamase class D
MRIFYFLPLLFLAFQAKAQDFSSLFSDCQVTGSTTVFDLKNNKWFFTNESGADSATLPASTFKIINLLIALETKAIKDENEIVKWPGKTDTVLYGYRPEIYHDMTVKEAFEVSAGWVFMGTVRTDRAESVCPLFNLVWLWQRRSFKAGCRFLELRPFCHQSEAPGSVPCKVI